MHLIRSIMLAPLVLAAGLFAVTNAVDVPVCPEDATDVPGATGKAATNEPVVADAALSTGGSNCPSLAAAMPTPVASAAEPQGVNILKNGNFVLGIRNWRNWQYASLHTNWVGVVTRTGAVGTYRALRIEDPDGSLVGVQQTVAVESGMVYKLSGSAQSIGTNSSGILFGARIGFLMRPQREEQLVWTTEFNQWWRKYVVFTNRVTGTGQVFIHMGYGKVASTGEFSDVRLERIGKVGTKGK